MGLAVNALSGALMVLLGVVVVALRGRRRLNIGFALFAVPFGATWMVENLVGGSALHEASGPQVAVGCLLVLAACGLLVIGAAAGRAAADAPRGQGTMALLYGLLIGGAQAGLIVSAYGWGVLGSTAGAVIWPAFWVFHGVSWGVLCLLALRYRWLPHELATMAAGIRLMSVALALYPAFYLSREAMAAVTYADWSAAATLGGLAVVIVPPLLLAGLWLRNAATAASPRGAAIVAMTILAAAFVGVPSLGFEGNHPGFGVARMIGVVLLGLAIVRHQLLGIDVRLRWTISRSALAGVFVAAFFVASEAAQEFFGDAFGHAYVGIVAAGAMVFLIAPLQQVAERVATHVVPPALPVASRPDAASLDPEAAFRAAVRAAYRGGALTTREERHLAEVALALGIDPVRAFEWRDAVRRESGGDGDAA